MLLSAPVVKPLVVINVPAEFGVTKLDTSNKRVGLVDYDWLANLVVNETIALGVTPQTLPIHLFSYVAEVNLNGSGALGFHRAANVSSDPSSPVLQTLIQTGYYSVNSIFAHQVGPQPQVANTGILAHEIAEWLNDPDDNFIPAWEDPAFPNICDNGLMEVGDPLEFISHGFQVASGGRAYNFPDIAFGTPVLAHPEFIFANGWFSF